MLLHDVDLDVAPGELCAVIGVSGSGKSTLLRALAGVTFPATGHVTIDGAPTLQRTDLVGYVPFGDLVHPQLTVREALTYAATLRLPGASRSQRDALVEEVIAELRMGGRADSFVGSLSDGERRRVACGSELVGQPRALVLDEPTTGLDPDLQRRLMTFLRGLADSGLAVVLSTHATASLDLCDRISVMRPGGEISFTGSARGGSRALRRGELRRRLRRRPSGTAGRTGPRRDRPSPRRPTPSSRRCRRWASRCEPSPRATPPAYDASAARC